MKFAELDSKVQDEIVDLLNNHLAMSASILKKDRCLLPMMMIPDAKQLISLQPQDGNIDVDKAYEVAVEKLKKTSFTYALFSYSTQIGLENGNIVNALKTYIFTADGIEVSFYSPFFIKGFFKKSITIEDTMLAEIKEINLS